jgi:hypothetical protein
LRVKSILALVIVVIFVLTSCTSGGVTPEGDNHTDEASNSAKDVLELVPVGWKALERLAGEPYKAEGDLNNDGINDIALVIEELEASAEGAPNRALLIAFGNEDNSYTLSIIAEHAVLKADEGGVFGDPLEDLTIDRGSVLLSFYGGSNWRWYSKYRFRYQDKDWYLIGATLGSYFTGTETIEQADEEDYNLLTGDYIKKTYDEDGKEVIEKGNRGKRELVKLRDFKANSEEPQF